MASRALTAILTMALWNCPGSARVAHTSRAKDVDSVMCSPSVRRSMSVMLTTRSFSWMTARPCAGDAQSVSS